MTVKDRPNLNTEIKQCNKTKIHYNLGTNSESFTASAKFMEELKRTSLRCDVIVHFYVT
jgi:hypothetical protein